VNRRIAAACVATVASACGPRATPPIEVPPPTTASAAPVEAGSPPSAPPPPPSGPEMTLVVGADAKGLGAHEPVRFAIDLAALRARPERDLGPAIDQLPQAQSFLDVTGVDLAKDGEWLVVYGTSLVRPERSALVVRHTKADADLSPRRPGSKPFGDVVIKPQAHVVALVPETKKAAYAAELARPLAAGLADHELLRAHLEDPAKLVAIPQVSFDGIARLDVVVRATDDGGVDAGADLACGSNCDATAAALRDAVRRANSMITKMALRGLLDPLEREGAPGIRVHDARIEARLHATPEQVAAFVNVVAALVGARP
jgi:hypothetical protein